MLLLYVGLRKKAGSMEPSLGDSVDDITGIVDDLVEDDVIEPVEPEPNKVLRQEPRRRNEARESVSKKI